MLYTVYLAFFFYFETCCGLENLLLWSAASCLYCVSSKYTLLVVCCKKPPKIRYMFYIYVELLCYTIVSASIFFILTLNWFEVHNGSKSCYVV